MSRSLHAYCTRGRGAPQGPDSSVRTAGTFIFELMEPRDWDQVQVAADRVVAESSEPFDPRTVANARELISICRAQCPLPTWVAKGYWSTISLSWPKFEIEVFEDRFEVYHFNDGGSTDIWYEMREPSGSFSERFLNELPRIQE